MRSMVIFIHGGKSLWWFLRENFEGFYSHYSFGFERGSFERSHPQKKRGKEIKKEIGFTHLSENWENMWEDNSSFKNEETWVLRYKQIKVIMRERSITQARARSHQITKFERGTRHARKRRQAQVKGKFTRHQLQIKRVGLLWMWTKGIVFCWSGGGFPEWMSGQIGQRIPDLEGCSWILLLCGCRDPSAPVVASYLDRSGSVCPKRDAPPRSVQPTCIPYYADAESSSPFEHSLVAGMPYPRERCRIWYPATSPWLGWLL